MNALHTLLDEVRQHIVKLSAEGDYNTCESLNRAERSIRRARTRRDRFLGKRARWEAKQAKSAAVK